MRVMLLAGAALLMTAQTAAAQMPALRIGPAAGIAITTVVGDDAEDADSRTSPYFGASIVAHAPVSRLGFETGVLYVPKGATTSVGGDAATVKLQYIEIPLLVRLGMSMGQSDVRPHLALGGSVGVNIGCKLEGNSGSTSISFDCDDEIFEGELEVKKIDFGLSAGAGLDVPIGVRGVFTPSIRYTRGMTDIGEADDAGDAKNSAIQIGASFTFSM